MFIVLVVFICIEVFICVYGIVKDVYENDILGCITIILFFIIVILLSICMNDINGSLIRINE